ncbi:sigma-54 interaction domain-containing protein [Terrilactibacillus tamarindi]|nr:sigma 54-interacting transcriptional regulator [Terrilactibacillus tamarindi]
MIGGLSLSNELLWKTIDNIPNPVIVTSFKGEIVVANQEATPLVINNNINDFGKYLVEECLEKDLILFGEKSYRSKSKEINQEYIVWYLIDFTDYITIQKNNEELLEVFQSSNDEIFVTDGEGTVLKVNKEGEKHYNLSADEMIGKKAEDLSLAGYFTPALTPDIIQKREKMSILQTTMDGRSLYVTGNPVFDKDGELTRIIYNCRDLTELKALEKRLEDTEFLLTNYRVELMKLGKKEAFIPLTSQSTLIKKLGEVIGRVATLDSAALILGEKGVGKSNIARILHDWSPRKDGPYIRMKCKKIPENVVENELFGYKKKSSIKTGETQEKGLVEIADGGTLFIDGIDNLNLSIQKKILRLLETKQFNRVGDSTLRSSNIRLIASSNQDLKLLVDSGYFLEELYYHLSVLPIQVPPLRQRLEEIPYIIDYFIGQYNEKYGLNKEIDIKVRERFLSHRWLGNIDELKDIIEGLVLTSKNQVIRESDLPDYIKPYEKPQLAISVHRIIPLKQAVEVVELELLKKAYKECGSTYKMASILEVNQSTIVRKMNKIKKSFQEK